MQRDYKIIPFPPVRQCIADFQIEAARNHTIRGLFDVDVTDIRRAIRHYRRETGNGLSLTGYLLYVYSHTLADYPLIQGYLKGRKKLVIFDDVDVNTIIEREIQGERQATTYILRAADKKELVEINRELEKARQSTKDSAIAGDTRKNIAVLVEKLPGFMRRLILAYVMRRNPRLRRHFFGTVGLTALSMFADKNGYGVPITPHVLGLLVGGLGKKPVVVGDKIKIREVLCLTLSMNHDVVDGAPAVRFLNDFHRRLQAGFGIEEHMKAVREGA